jgi:Tfp pilus assembly protein PilX
MSINRQKCLPENPRHQRGAVTAIMVLVVILIVTTLVMILLDATTSESMDTAEQNDSVEALYLAESGLERASWRYITGGVACTSLAPDGPNNFGRGSFTVDSADQLDFDGVTALAAGRCRVRVTGTVGSIKRTVEAIIELPSAGGMVVGNNGTVLQCGSGGCATVTSPTGNNLRGVYCSADDDCWIVGDNGAIFQWNGSSWSDYSIAASVQLTDVSCEPGNPNNCMASGSYIIWRVVLHWNGAGWSGSYFSFFDFGSLSAVACPSAVCYAVGPGGNIRRYIGFWSAEGSGTSQNLNGVDCWSNNDCWAVADRSGNAFVFDRRTAGGWSPLVMSSPSNRENLNAVTCYSGSDCWAVGDRQGNKFTFVHWNGSSWTPTPLSDNTNRRDLFGVDCRATDDCLAVGGTGRALYWDGGSWTVVSAGTVTTEDLNDVSMPDLGGGGGGGGGGGLVKWHEIIAQ